MTLIAGYIHSDTVHIVCDSALTMITNIMDKSPIIKNGYSSFGELVEFNDHQVVTESAQKIYSLNNSTLLAFSGQVEEGNGILEDLRIEISISNGKKLSSTLSDFFSKRKPNLTQYIIGFQENDKANLFIFDNKIKN